MLTGTNSVYVMNVRIYPFEYPQKFREIPVRDFPFLSEEFVKPVVFFVKKKVKKKLPPTGRRKGIGFFERFCKASRFFPQHMDHIICPSLCHIEWYSFYTKGHYKQNGEKSGMPE